MRTHIRTKILKFDTYPEVLPRSPTRFATVALPDIPGVNVFHSELADPAAPGRPGTDSERVSH